MKSAAMTLREARVLIASRASSRTAEPQLLEAARVVLRELDSRQAEIAAKVWEEVLDAAGDEFFVTPEPKHFPNLQALVEEHARYKRGLETIVKTTKLGGAADIARRALGSEFIKR